MNIFKKIAKIISNIIIYFLIVLLTIYIALVLYQKFVQKSELLSLGSLYIFQIASSSMETNLHIGDYIIVLKTDDLQVGDVITFKENNFYITHRIQKIDGDKITTKGDANQDYDDSITKDIILGKVLCKASILSFVVKYKFLLITIILIMFILDSLFNCNLKKEGNIEKKDEIEKK